MTRLCASCQSTFHLEYSRDARHLYSSVVILRPSFRSGGIISGYAVHLDPCHVPFNLGADHLGTLDNAWD